jgi:hypothetical protein
MNEVRRRCLLVISVLTCGYCFEVSAQHWDPARLLTASDRTALATEFGTGGNYVENGEIVGVRIDRPGTLLKPLGIEPGDIVVQLNGESLAKAEFGAFSRFAVVLAHAQSFELVVRSRNGETRTVSCANRQAGCTGP